MTSGGYLYKVSTCPSRQIEAGRFEYSLQRTGEPG
jgi:hypothetical protein